MKSFWILSPSPYKSAKSNNAKIYNNLCHAQNHLKRALTRAEVVKIIKKLKDKGLVTSKQDASSLMANFMSTMKTQKMLSESPPEQ